MGKGHFEPDRHFLGCLKTSVNVLLNQSHFQSSLKTVEMENIVNGYIVTTGMLNNQHSIKMAKKTNYKIQF